MSRGRRRNRPNPSDVQRAAVELLEKALSPNLVAGAQRRAGGMSLVDAARLMTGQTPAGNGTFTAVPMPRSPLDEVPFGPLWPLQPMPIDPARRDTGRPEPRISEYPVAWNVPGSGERAMPWRILRDAADGVDIIRRCIQIRQRHIRGLDGAWSVSEKAVQETYRDSGGKLGREDAERELREKYLPEIRRMETFWKHPWKSNGWSFGQWVNAVIEEHLVLDAVAVYPRATYGGDVLALEVLDGTTIKPLLDYRGARPQAPNPAFQQLLYGFPRGEWHATPDSVDAEGNAMVSNAFLADQLFYGVENVRPFTPYGYSAVEQALISAKLYLARQGWMISEYDDGIGPMVWLVPQAKGQGYSQINNAVDGMTPQMRRDWQDSINALLSGNTKARHRAQLSLPGMTPIFPPTVDERYKPEYDLHLIKLLAGHFGVTMTELGFTEAKGLGNSGLHEGQADVEQRVGQRPDERMIAELINELSHDFMRCPPEVCFRFTSDEAEETVDQDAVAKSRRERATITLNDDRREAGLAPLDIPEADMPLILQGGQWMPLEGLAERAKQEQELAQQMAQDQLATSEQDRELAQQSADLEAETAAAESEEEMVKAVERRALARFRNKGRNRGGRPFICKHLAPSDFAEGVPPDVDFEGWAWVPDGLDDDATDDEIAEFLGGEISKAFGRGNDNWRTLARDSRGRWVARGSMRVSPLGPDRPSPSIVDGLRANAAGRRAGFSAQEMARAQAEYDSQAGPGARGEARRRLMEGAGITPLTIAQGHRDREAAQRREREQMAALAAEQERRNLEMLRAHAANLDPADIEAGMQAELDTADRVARGLGVAGGAGEGTKRAIRDKWADPDRQAVLVAEHKAALARQRAAQDRAGRVNNPSTTVGGMTNPKAPELPLTAQRSLDALRRNNGRMVVGMNRDGFNAQGVPALERAGLVTVLDDDGVRTVRLTNAGWGRDETPDEEARLAVARMSLPEVRSGAHGYWFNGIEYPSRKTADAARERRAHELAMEDAVASEGGNLRGEQGPDEGQRMAEQYRRDNADMTDGELAANRRRFGRRDGVRTEHEDSVRDAVTSLQAEPGAWVSLTDVRARLAERGMDRAQQDATLKRMITAQSVVSAPEENQKVITDADRAAALHIGGEDRHLVMIEPPRAAAPVKLSRAATVKLTEMAMAQGNAASMPSNVRRPDVEELERAGYAVRDGNWSVLTDAGRAAAPAAPEPTRPDFTMTRREESALARKAGNREALRQGRAANAAAREQAAEGPRDKGERLAREREAADPLGEAARLEAVAERWDRVARSSAGVDRSRDNGMAQANADYARAEAARIRQAQAAVGTPPAVTPAPDPTPVNADDTGRAAPKLSKRQRDLAAQFDRLAGEHGTDPAVAQWRQRAIDLTGEMEQVGRGVLERREADRIRDNMASVQDEFTHAMAGAQVAKQVRDEGGDEREQAIARTRATLDSRARKVAKRLDHLERQIKDYTGETRKTLRKRINEAKAERQRYLDRIESAERDHDTKLVYDADGKLVGTSYEPPAPKRSAVQDRITDEVLAARRAGDQRGGGEGAGTAAPEPAPVRRGPEVADHPQKAAFDKLLDEGLVKHKQARQIVEQMEAHGWTLTDQNPMVSVTQWEAPDGRKMAVQFLTGDKPKFYPGGNVTGGNPSYKAALAHVVTPTHAEVGGPNIYTAANKVSPGLGDRVSGRITGGGQADQATEALSRAARQLSGYGGTARRTPDEVMADLREQADRLDALAQSNAEHHERMGMADLGGSKVAERQREQAAWLRQIADVLAEQAAERAAYEAERDRRAAAPLDIRPTTRRARK